MNTAVILNETERAALVEYYTGRVQTLQRQQEQINNELKEVLLRLNQFTDEIEIMQQVHFNKYIAYDMAAPLWKKVEYILSVQSKVLNTRDIATIIDRLEYDTTTDIKTIISNLGATLKQKVDKGEAFSRVELRGEWYYGLNEWFEGDFLKDAYVRNELDDDTVRD